MATMVENPASHPAAPPLQKTKEEEEEEAAAMAQQQEQEAREEGEGGRDVVPPSFHLLADDWNQYFVEVGDWLVR